ncbi:MAG: phosphatidylinositol-specific phospholipase C1-like protein [Bryobacterales bacterium]|nr:phosphatidylinositol-specific phospholipase C1-like protein [Bryobacterales bacterium]
MTNRRQWYHRPVAKGFRKLLLLALISTALSAQGSADEALLNQIQVLGSHNSYKKAIDPPLLKLLRENNPDSHKGLEYAHVSLPRQLDLGLRKLELDVFHDPEGGRYRRPYGLEMLRQANLLPEPPYDPQGFMQEPGLKVLHIQDIDFRSHVYTFRQALLELRAWSNAHPRHLPIVITMNAKDSRGRDPNSTPALPFDKEAFDAWDAEIREILPDEKLLTPDDVRGAYLTLEAAVLDHAWPTLGESRGRFLFVLDETGEKLDTYLQGHSSLRGRVMFVNAMEGRPEAAFRIVNSPNEDFQYIQRLVRAGYLVRTRADANTQEARQGDYRRMEAAFDSGAQFISTDYYLPNPEFGTGYQVRLPGGGPGRWNPLLSPSNRPETPLE